MIYQVKLDMTGKILEVYYSLEKTMMKSSIVPALNCFKHDQTELIDHIKTVLVPYDGKDYNFSSPIVAGGEAGLPLHIDQLIFGGKLKNGFFIEAGSQDGEENSNTLHFELAHDWSGLLVEAHPVFYSQGLAKHRNTTSLMTCLAIENRPHFMDFDYFSAVKDKSMAGLVPQPTDSSFRMQCLPLYSLLLALGNPTVHYFSLDIEGAELGVLRTVPWDLVDIWVISVETHMAGDVFPGTREDIIQYMKSVGYRLLDWNEDKSFKDDLFVRENIKLLDEGRPNEKTEL